MKATEVNQYLEARKVLIKRREVLRQELGEVESALSPEGISTEVAPIIPHIPRPVATTVRHGTTKPAAKPERGYGELTEKVSEAIGKGALTKKDIIAALNAQKFDWGGPPLQVLDSVIYTKHFARNGKLFSIASAKSKAKVRK